MKYDELRELQCRTQERVCLFGAGMIGCTWAYDLLSEMGFHIDFYCDNHKKENTVVRNGIKTISIDTLYSLKGNVLVFITMADKYQREIRKQLEDNGIYNIIETGFYFLQTFIESLLDMNDQSINKQFACVLNDEEYIRRQFKFRLGYELNLNNPQTLNEKIQWLKINDRKTEYTQLADKYAVRQYIETKFGKEFLIPLLFKTEDCSELTYNNIPDEACIIKTNHGCGGYQIVRNKEKIDWEELQIKFKRLLLENYYYSHREFQYKYIKPLIIVEKLLMLPSGKIPNDYKLHFLNGKCEFVYCSIDREGANYRKVYDTDWKPLGFVWVSGAKDLSTQQGIDIPKPKSFEKMMEIGGEIAKNMRYVRVDFYDVNGKLYCGEITLHHGAGNDAFYPKQYDLYYGQKLKLNNEADEWKAM